MDPFKNNEQIKQHRKMLEVVSSLLLLRFAYFSDFVQPHSAFSSLSHPVGPL